MQNTNTVIEDGKYEELFDTPKFLHEHFNSAEKYYEEYLPELWKNITPEMLESGHGGKDYVEFVEFCDCLRTGREMPIDVYDAAAWMSIAYLSEQSIANGGTSVEIPDFTNGEYKTREPKDVIELPGLLV